ncbi:MAG: cellulose synthase subunit BcsC-related outer membrane protein, partial [Thiobacillaceae bacterium]
PGVIVQDDHAWRAALYREPVRDSVLALLGQRDPTSGMAWGRVMRDGLSLGGYRRLGAGPWSLAGQVRLEQLTGRSVEDNQHLAAQIELMHGFTTPGFRFLQAGPTLGWEGYRRDLSAYTWGHGGYFSPQGFTQAGAAVQFETAARADWLLAGRLSAQWQRVARDAAPCHPLPPPVGPSTCTGGYAGERKQGLATQVELRAVTRLAPRWHLAGAAGLRHGPAYRDHALGLTLVHLFEPQTTVHPEDLPAGMSALW